MQNGMQKKCIPKKTELFILDFISDKIKVRKQLRDINSELQ